MITLRHIKISEEIPLDLERITNISFEHPTHYYNFLMDLNDSFKGTYDNLEFFKDDKSINIANNALFIPDIITFDINSRKLKTDITKGISRDAEEELKLEIQNLNAQLIKLMKANVTTYGNVSFKEDLDLSDFVKFLDFTIDDQKETLIERLMIWINTFIELYRTTYFIFVNLLDYLTDNDVMELIEFCKQEKIAIIIISRYKNNDKLPTIKEFIIDIDTCLIIKNK